MQKSIWHNQFATYYSFKAYKLCVYGLKSNQNKTKTLSKAEEETCLPHWLVYQPSVLLLFPPLTALGTPAGFPKQSQYYN